LDETFHLDAMIEMLRVCEEIRIFPLLTLTLQPSPYLAPIIRRLSEQGYDCTIERTAYELQRGGNQMLIITQTEAQ
jgi:hypothetical protein